MSEIYWLTEQDLVEIDVKVIQASGGSHGVLNQKALESTLNKAKNRYYYEEGVSLFDLAASYCYRLVKNHCSIDGNERTALIPTYRFLLVNGWELEIAEDVAAAFFWDLAASTEPEESCLVRIATWLESHCQARPS